MKNHVFYFFLIASLIVSCNSSNDDSPGSGTMGDGSGDPSRGGGTQEWLIPISQVKDGGPGKDGIPSIDSPIFVDASVAESSFLNDDDLVIGMVRGNEAKAYPHLVLDWHEIVNDEINGEAISVNYCPLTGTAFGWKSISNGQKTTFGVSGLLYNTNLILYDRNTDSNWPQLLLKAAQGSLIGDTPTLVDVVETNWKTWKALYPNTKVLSTNTGFSRNYNNYPYGDYRTNQNFFLFQPSPLNSALPNKQRIYAIIDNEKSKIYRFTDFGNGRVIKDSFNGNDFLIVGNGDIIYAFEMTPALSTLNFEYDFNNTEAFFKDDEGNKWSIFGKAIEGPRTGEQLKGAKSVVSMWFAIAAFYPNPEIF